MTAPPVVSPPATVVGAPSLVAETPVAAAPTIVAETPVAAASAIVAETPVAEPPVVAAAPVAERPVVAAAPVAESPLAAAIVDPFVAAIVAEPAPPLAASLPEAPSLPPTGISLPPPTSASNAHLVDSIPPAWLALARKRPVLWMAVAPVVLGSLLIAIVAALQPPPVHKLRVEATPSAAANTAVPTVTEPTITREVDKATGPTLAQLEAKPADSLSVDELLLVNAGHAKQKRDDAVALSRKLQQDPEVAKDASVQTELLRLAADPDTANAALGAMAQTNSSIGPDLLYQVWTNRSAPASTAELARSLLYSHDVRPHASPALAVALQLRAADSCETVRATLPQALSNADTRSVAPLAKLNARRGCGAQKTEDCYACLRPQMKPVIAAIAAAKRRRAPSYPAH